jgi:hypothetical protein
MEKKIVMTISLSLKDFMGSRDSRDNRLSPYFTNVWQGI